jgi:translation initiation factor IF-2
VAHVLQAAEAKDRELEQARMRRAHEAAMHAERKMQEKLEQELQQIQEEEESKKKREEEESKAARQAAQAAAVARSAGGLPETRAASVAAPQKRRDEVSLPSISAKIEQLAVRAALYVLAH